MSSAEQNSPKEQQSQVDKTIPTGSLKSPPKRPALVSPPRRPAGRPAASEEGPPSVKPDQAAASLTAGKATASSPPADATPSTSTGEDATTDQRCQPIAPPSEPMQYRAIGLVRGTYQPTEADQLNRGNLFTEDGAAIDAVLLGRVTSLVKKHLDLAVPHLWVVYPRTRRNDDNQDNDLHLQIVGVWEPETLGLPGEPAPKGNQTNGDMSADASKDTPDASEDTTDSEVAPATPAAAEEEAVPPSTSPESLPDVNDNYFSIRGEVVKYSPEEEFISVKILQGIKRSPGTSKPFKVNLRGTIEGRTVGYFWDFQARREDNTLVLQEASVVGIVPPKKRSKRSGGPVRSGRGDGKRPMPSRRSVGSRDSHRPRRVDAGKDLRA
jgi:hypothetical protein